MRLVAYSMMVLAGVAIWELKSSKDFDQGQELADASSKFGVDTMVIGASIPDEHLADWEARNRIKKVCDGCRVYTQPFPGDLDQVSSVEILNSDKK